MIECLFTIDYELYGNGEGSLKDLVYEPARQLKSIFDKAEAKLVVFVEAAELEKIDISHTDPTIDQVKDQIREFHRDGYEIALHLHPQWCNATYDRNKWSLDYSEYNLCTLPKWRIREIVASSITYLRDILNTPDFTPLSFRAGNWLFQPTHNIAQVLAEHGVKIDSSVFKGGRQRRYRLDYVRTRNNGYFWNFEHDVTTPNPNGKLLEIPIYTKMVPFWKMLTPKRIGLQNKMASRTHSASDRFNRLFDFLRFRHPLKFDFCRMTMEELITTTEQLVLEDRSSPDVIKPMVAIGHTKDLVDFATVEAFLSYLHKKGIRITTFESIYPKFRLPASQTTAACS